MTVAFEHFGKKMAAAGLVETGSPLFGFLDADLTWNRSDPARHLMAPLFDHLAINSLLFAMPAEPYATVITYLAEESSGRIHPRDSETRTFLHDLPVAGSLDPTDTLPLLKQRKGVIIPGRGVITWGTVSLEQAYVTFSSICFACLVKFFADHLAHAKRGTIDPRRQSVFDQAVAALPPATTRKNSLTAGPFNTEAEILGAMTAAGRRTVADRLVDSYFGNISYLLENVLYISQTGSSLDALEDCIDPCPLDGSSCAAITASSELSAHMKIVEGSDCRAVLHGHPPFAVILSMDCHRDDGDCPHECHLNCPHDRSACGVPIVPGEVGTGPYGLCRTVPPALTDNPGVIVYGHGVFTTGKSDFNAPFNSLVDIEAACRKEYFRRVRSFAD
jgi:ribulose-5-phosphate 4-epimerase/fuculose-1-phosphate aldolase